VSVDVVEPVIGIERINEKTNINADINKIEHLFLIFVLIALNKKFLFIYIKIIKITNIAIHAALVLVKKSDTKDNEVHNNNKYLTFLFDIIMIDISPAGIEKHKYCEK